MNLNTPVYDNVLAIDEQLLALEREVSHMDSEFKDYNPRSALPKPQTYPKIPNGNYSDPSTEDFSSGEMGPRKVTFVQNAAIKKQVIPGSSTNFKAHDSRYNNLPG